MWGLGIRGEGRVTIHNQVARLSDCDIMINLSGLGFGGIRFFVVISGIKSMREIAYI